MTPTLEMVERLVELIEADGLPLDAAVWTLDEIDRWRLYLVPRQRDESNLRSTIRVAATISKHADDLPDRDELLFSVVDPHHPIVQAVKSLNLDAVTKARKISGVYGNGRYIDRAYVLRLKP